MKWCQMRRSCSVYWPDARKVWEIAWERGLNGAHVRALKSSRIFQLRKEGREYEFNVKITFKRFITEISTNTFHLTQWCLLNQLCSCVMFLQSGVWEVLTCDPISHAALWVHMQRQLKSSTPRPHFKFKEPQNPNQAKIGINSDLLELFIFW
jgi:hypothetical protein